MSKLNEIKSRPATIVFTSRCDARYLATLLNFWTDSGEKIGSASELVRLSIESFAEFLAHNGKTQMVQTHADALQIIELSGLMTKKMSGMNAKNRMLAMQLEDSKFDSLEGAWDPQKGHKKTIKSKPVSNIDPDLTQAQKKLEEALEEDKQERIDKAKENTQNFKDEMGIIPKGE